MRVATATLVLILSGLWFNQAAITSEPGAKSKVDFNRDVRPILVDNCLQCHGPDEKERKAKLRLDVREAALAKPGVLIPGKAQESALLERIATEEAEHRMPPAKTGKSLSKEQIDVLRRWIDEGAKWSDHWAYVPPVRPVAPGLASTDPFAARRPNAIDHFVRQQQIKHGLAPNPEAAKATLIRRLSLDLLGLPPTLAEVDAFMADTAPDAYERSVDRILTSKHFGERMAQHWLDLARFGDSDGYHDDTPRVAYQFRDYVIDSFNANKPFNQFTVEQLAGDLLPNATLEQKVGSAFHRMGPTTSEGGADAAEYLVKYAVDRVNTTATTWLGVTLNCAECHDHKYDPFTTKEYYQLLCFFNQVPEDVLFRGNDAPPVIPTPTKAQQRQLAELQGEITKAEAEIRKELAAEKAELVATQRDWEDKLLRGETDTLKFTPWQAIGPFSSRDGQKPPFEFVYPPEEEIDLKKTYEEGKLKWEARPNFVDGKVHYLGGENCATYFHRTVKVSQPEAVMLYLGSDDGIKVWVNGKLVHEKILVRGAAPNQDKAAITLQPGENQILMKIVNLQGGYGFYFSTKEKAKDEALDAVVAAAKVPLDQRTAEQSRVLRDYYRERFDPRIRELTLQIAEATQKKGLLEQAVPRLRIMADMPKRRPTHVLLRGDFRSLGEEVQPGVPVVLGALANGEKPNRLALAKWLTDPKHPLTARVAVNRFWQTLFGQALVRTPEDLGVRGEAPSHPELLDWLAVEFVDSGWDVKRLLKLMVTSATYRQSSQVSKEALQKDPYNTWLARGPRHRLAAETLRDNALAIAGLFDRDRPVGGPSVKPYQPGDLWREMAYGDSADKAYVQDKGPDLYRRGLYVYWKRSIHYPAFGILDAPNREVCVARRPITNTPLQAFVLLNDVTFVEAARVFAERVMKEGGTDFAGRLQFAYRAALAREPETKEKVILAAIWQQLVEKYQNDQAAAQKLVSAGEYRAAKDLPILEHAAWTALCQVILNLDETVTKE